MAAPTSTKSKVVSTGNAEIDKKLGGGIPSGSLMLIEGKSDSGKSVLLQQMMWGSLREGTTVSLLTTENTVKSLVKQMQSLNLDILDYLLLGRFNIYPVKATQAKDGAEESLKELHTAITRLKGRDLVAVDSITPFIVHSSSAQVVGFFEECKSLCNDGMSVALVAHPYAFDQTMLVRISSMCDTHLRLSIENLGEKLMKTLEVAKVRGAEKSTGNVVSFDVEPGWGMRIIPFTKAKA